MQTTDSESSSMVLIQVSPNHDVMRGEELSRLAEEQGKGTVGGLQLAFGVMADGFYSRLGFEVKKTDQVSKLRREQVE